MNKNINEQLNGSHNSQKFKSTLSPEGIERLKDLALDNRVLDELSDEENMSIEELGDIEQSVSAKDPNFRSELDYNGYKDIEGYDNDEYNANMDDVADDKKELSFSDRVEDESNVEESPVDVQANRRNPSDAV